MGITVPKNKISILKELLWQLEYFQFTIWRLAILPLECVVICVVVIRLTKVFYSEAGFVVIGIVG